MRRCRSKRRTAWGWSEALYDHKAFQYWAPKKLLAIPQSTYAYENANGHYYYRYLSQLVLVNVDPTSGALSIKGRIDHSPYYNAEPEHVVAATSTSAAASSWATTSTRSATRRSPRTA